MLGSDELAYKSGRLAKIKGKMRGFVRGKAYIFAINGGVRREMVVVELHSSITLNASDRIAAGRTAWYQPHASTEIVVSVNEARHLLSALLAALEKASKEGIT